MGVMKLPNAIEGSMSLCYFPPMYGKPDCPHCDRRCSCMSCDKFQRDTRSFTYTSGCCPRLPDIRGLHGRERVGFLRYACNCHG